MNVGPCPSKGSTAVRSSANPNPTTRKAILFRFRRRNQRASALGKNGLHSLPVFQDVTKTENEHPRHTTLLPHTTHLPELLDFPNGSALESFYVSYL